MALTELRLFFGEISQRKKKLELHLFRDFILEGNLAA